MARGGLKRLAERLESNVAKALFNGGEIVAGEAALSITTGSSGGQKGDKHQHVPSRPGEAPNEEFGGLRGNIEVIQEEPLKVVVSSNASYSQHLEFGTSRMRPRPFMGPAINRTRKEVQQKIAEAVSYTVKTSGAS